MGVCLPSFWTMMSKDVPMAPMTPLYGGIREDQTVMTASGPVRAGDVRAGDRVISRNGASSQVLSVERGVTQGMYAVTTCDGVCVVVSEYQPWSVLVRRTHPAGSKAYVLHNTAEVRDLLTQPCTVFLPTLTNPARMSELGKNWMDAVSSRSISVFEALSGSLDGEHTRVDISDAKRVREAMWSLGGTAELRKAPSDADHVILRMHAPHVLSSMPTRGKTLKPSASLHPPRRIVSVSEAGEARPVMLELDAPDSLIALSGFVLTGWAGVPDVLPIND